MVNFGLNSASILGIFLAVAGAGLYFLRSIRPELSRDHDIFFAAVGLLCGLILLFQGWRLDPILQFGQFLLTGSAIFFAVETVRLRGATTEQARRNTPIVDPDRKVSRTNVYTEAVLDQLEPYEDEDYSNYRSLRGEADPRPSRSSGYDSETPRAPRGRRSSTSRSTAGSSRYDDSYDSRETPRQRRPRSSTPPATSQYDDWNDSDERERPTTSRPRRPRPSSEYSDAPPEAPRKRRPRPSDIADLGGTPYEDDSIPTDYVDYQPIDESEAEDSSWEQEPRQNPERNPEREPRNNSDEPRDNPVRFDY